MWTKHIEETRASLEYAKRNKKLSDEVRKWTVWRIEEHLWLLEIENERLWRESKAKTVEEVIEFWKKEKGILTT